jgi:hypothetical protein
MQCVGVTGDEQQDDDDEDNDGFFLQINFIFVLFALHRSW